MQVVCPRCTRTITLRPEIRQPTIYCPTCGQIMAIPPAARTAYAGAPLTGPVRYAGFWIRAAAAVIDLVLLCVPAAVLTAQGELPGGWLLYAAYKGICLAWWNGQTFGKKICGIRVVADSLRPCATGQAFVRAGAELISAVAIFVGYLLAGFDERKQALHDKLAGTIHVHV